MNSCGIGFQPVISLVFHHRLEAYATLFLYRLEAYATLFIYRLEAYAKLFIYRLEAKGGHILPLGIESATP